MRHFLPAEDLLRLTDDLGVGPVRDVGLLELAVACPQTSLWGKEVYPPLEMKAAALLDSLVDNHPLVDENKRLGWLATVVLPGINGQWPGAPNDDVYDLVVEVASGRSAVEQAADALRKWGKEDDAR